MVGVALWQAKLHDMNNTIHYVRLELLSPDGVTSNTYNIKVKSLPSSAPSIYPEGHTVLRPCRNM